MHHKALMLLCLLEMACGSAPVQRELHHGAMPPGAPAFSAMESAPHTLGQPGYVPREEVPRSPYTRVLPETPETRREAGIWSAEVPRAISDEDRAVVNPYLASLRIVLPEDDTLMGDPTDARPARWCSVIVKNLIRDEAGILRAHPVGSETARQCLAARLLAECIKRVDADPSDFRGLYAADSPRTRAALADRRDHMCAEAAARDGAATYDALVKHLDVNPGRTR